MRLLIFLGLCLLGGSQLLPAQLPAELSGSWSGELLQNEGGFADRFEIHLDLEQYGIFMKGKAFVKLGKLEAEMAFSGTQLANGSWRLTETKILRQNKAGLAVSWCMKQYELRLSYAERVMTLSGPWWGESEYGPCVPGSVRLQKKIKTAGLLLGRQDAVNVHPHG